MPDRGLLELSQIRAPETDGYASWEIPSARILHITFEVNRESALALMPGDVSRPVPCYARFVTIDAAEGPAGPFRLGALFVGGRYRMLPRNVLADALVDGPADAFTANFGGPARAGHIRLDRDGPAAVATVADNIPLATVCAPALRAVDPAMLRWDPWLGYASNDGVVNIVEFALKPAPTEAFLSKGGTFQLAPDLPREHAWRGLRNLNTVSACYAEGPLVLTAPEVQQAIL